MRSITKIILHCSASLEGIDLTGNDIRSMHTNPVRLGNREFAAKACPCFEVRQEFPEFSQPFGNPAPLRDSLS